MKFFFLSLCVFAVVGTGLIACNNGDYSATPGTVNNGANPIYHPPANGDGSFKANIGGNEFVATSAYYLDTVFNGDTIFQIVGAIIPNNDPTSEKSIAISISGYKGVGTYSLDHDTGSASVLFIPNGISGGFQSADSGSITITDVSNSQISGTFKFTTDSVNVTDGSFDKLKKQ